MTAAGSHPAPAATTGSDPNHIPISMLFTVGSLAVFGPLSFDAYIPTLPVISRTLHASASQVQLSLTSCLIGMALGQFVVGPIGDRLGRRRPLFVGLALFAVASVACALSTSVWMLIAFRLLQGAGGSAGIVLGRAVVRDLYSGAVAARFFSLLMLVTGLALITAPQFGAVLQHFGSWRLVFVFLAVVSVLLLVSSYFKLPETLPPDRRHTNGWQQTASSFKSVLADRRFLVNGSANALALGALFANLAGCSFALENVYGLSPQMFSLDLAINAVGMIIAAVSNGGLVAKHGPRRMLTVGMLLLSSAATALLLVILFDLPLFFVLVCLFVLVSSTGMVLPNTTALALNDFPHAAGTASATLGAMQFGSGAIAAPLVGIGGTHDAMPMAVVICGFSLAAVFLRLVSRTRDRAQAVGVPIAIPVEAGPIASEITPSGPSSTSLDVSPS